MVEQQSITQMLSLKNYTTLRSFGDLKIYDFICKYLLRAYLRCFTSAIDNA